MAKTSYHQDYDKVKRRLRKAFTQLRSNGFIARQNFLCCGNCGHHAMDSELTEKNPGYVFYHSQDNDSLKRRGQVYLAFSSNLNILTEKEAGEIIADACLKAGLTVQWNFSANTRILVGA